MQTRRFTQFPSLALALLYIMNAVAKPDLEAMIFC